MKTILLIEDGPSLRDSTKRWLEVKGFTVETANSYTERPAKFLAKTHRIVVSDNNLGDGLVIDLTREIKEHSPDTLVCLWSGVWQPAERKQHAEHPADLITEKGPRGLKALDNTLTVNIP